MFEGFFDLLGSVLNFFYTLIPSYGVSIMLLTVLVMVLITPLTVKSTRSMLQMQRLQPEMKRLQAKYKNDREKLNEELMKFYKENSINPLGGCLPILAQMPVFIIMYQLLRGLTTRVGGLGSGIGHIGGQVQRAQELTPWIFTDQNFRPQHLNTTTELYQSLSQTNTMKFLGMDLSLSASQALKNGLIIALPYLFLLLVILVTGIYQNRQLQARNKDNANVNPQQQAIMKVMPFFLPVFSFGFPSGLALYWCTQNFCRIGTNAYITRSIYAKDKAAGPIETTATETPSKGKKSTPEVGSGNSKKNGSGGGAKGGGAKSDSGKNDSGKGGGTASKNG
ncbi:MAG: YidC/Oxa1 family membrane protein insertase, partial [Microthrixaceae bacterium]